MGLLSFGKTKQKAVETEQRIEELKEKLKQVHGKYLLSVYVVLKEIFDLRIAQIPSYTLFDLAREKGIEQKPHHVHYLFGFMYMSKTTKKLLEEGKLKPSTVLTIIASAKRFRDPIKQDGLVDLYLNGMLTTTEIAKYDSYHLLQMVESDTHMTNKNKIDLHLVYNTKTLKNMAEKYGKDLEPMQKKKLKDNFKEFAKEVAKIVEPESIYKCPYCNRTIDINKILNGED